MTPTSEQSSILQAAIQSEDNLLISALAGAAKTSTLCLIAEALPKVQMLCLAFNKRIAEEMQKRLPANCEARTLNSLGHKAWGDTIGRRCAVDTSKSYKLLRAEIEGLRGKEKDQAWKEMAETLEMIDFAKSAGYVPTGHFPDAKRLMDDETLFDALDPMPNDLQFGLVKRVMIRSIKLGFEGNLDFADQLLLPTVFSALFPVFSLVLVDETQDLSALNHAMLRKLVRKRLIGVGDSLQCQPPGTLVRTPSGDTPIEQLKEGDEIISYHRDKTRLRPRVVLKTASRFYSGELIKIITPSALMHEVTPSHRCVVKIREAVADWHAVYLMQRGNDFRIGETILHRKDEHQFGLALRARQEKADAIWLLSTHRTKEEALAQEQILVATFGITDTCFINSGKVAIPQERLDWVWKQIGNNQERAEVLLQTFGREIEFPLWSKLEYQHVGFSKYFLMRACNLETDLFEVPVAAVSEYDVNWEPVHIVRRHYSGEVHSLEIEKTESTNNNGLYIANGIVTGNSIYAFRGAHQQSMGLMQEQFGMREQALSITFRCPQSVVRAARWRAPSMKWPDWAIEGQVREAGGWGLDDVPDHAAVICRNNAPLFGMAIRFLKRGRNCRIVGNDIGKGLLRIMGKFGQPSLTQEDVLRAVEDWTEKQLTKSRSPRSTHDRADCMRLFANNGNNLGEAVAYAKHLFEQEGPVTFLTGHKAKGLEFDDVFLLDRHLIRTDEEEQEKNLLYVTQTRAKKTLTYVTSEGFDHD